MNIDFKLRSNYDNNIILSINGKELKESFYQVDDALLYIYNITQKYSPLSVYFELTNSCNFKCPFCYINYSDRNKKFLNVEKLKKYIDFLVEKGMVYATLSGGECLLHPNFEEIYMYLYNKGVLITILSNGSLVNENIIRLFEKNKPYKIEISLYGSNNNKMYENTKQDKYNFEDLKQIILKLKDKNINIICKMPINTVTENSFVENLSWCRENEIEFYYSDELFDKYDRSSNDEFKLKNKKIKEQLENDMYSLYRQMNFNLSKCKKCFDCKAGKYSVILSFDECLYPCFEFRQLKEGIFKIEDDISLAYNNLEEYIKKFKNTILKHCQGCNAYLICKDCVINHINGKSNCDKYRKELVKIMKNLEKEEKELIEKYDTKELSTERLDIKKGTGKDCVKIYEYDMLKCRGIAGEDVLVKSEKPVNFIGDNAEEYYKECAKEKMFDWYIYLKDGTPIANVIADRQIEDINSIELSFNMHPNYWRKGYMKEAVSKIMDFLFDFGYDNIIVSYDSGNIKSESFARKLGFKDYKVMKNTYQKNGINIDTTLLIMPKDEWIKLDN